MLSCFYGTYVLLRSNYKKGAAKRRRVNGHVPHTVVIGEDDEVEDDEVGEDFGRIGLNSPREEVVARLSEAETGAVLESMHHAHHEASHSSMLAAISLESLKGLLWCYRIHPLRAYMLL